ncbi:unnamed protein product [Mytilus coruscus]|uniref:MEGF10_11 n=1 Tax=Mytilus coruscus TaxID=42192 RepID=A0A6J8E6G7_MYTCO|nr:unnamed protein product [Mytilus coruscus]
MAGSPTCDFKTDSGEVIKVCCADYEANGNDCIGCSIGYTSDIGQMCQRCSNNMYGERCRYQCSCSRFEIGEVRLECCADSEAKGNNCIDFPSFCQFYITACSKGYTSVIGQNCLPCTRLTYGDRCKFECHCSDFESCNHVDGCVQFSSTAGTSVDTTSYITTLPWNEAARTTGDSTDNSSEGGSNSSGSGENTLFVDESQYERNQDYSNLPVISPPNIKDYITKATVHRIESTVPDNKKDTPCEHEYRLQQINAPKKDALQIASINVRFTVPKRSLSNITERVSQSCNNLNIGCIKSNMFTGNNDENINSTDDSMLVFHDMFKAKSESNIV